MKFSRKIFLSIFGTAAFAALVICLALYATLSRDRRAQFEESYVDHMNLLAKALSGIEESEAHIALNAARSLRVRDDQIPGPYFGSEMKKLIAELGVDEINIYNAKGILLESSDQKPHSLSANFPDLKIGDKRVRQTPLVATPGAAAAHHTLIASADKGYIEVVTYFETATQLLKEMALHDEDSLALELFGATGNSLGKIQRDDYQAKMDSQTALAWGDGIHWNEGRMFVLTTVKTVENDSKKNYRLLATVSARSLEKDLRSIQITLVLAALILLLFSWLLSRFLTRVLLRKVESLRGLLSRITQTQDYSARVPVLAGPTPDELEDLGQNLNSMLQTLQSNQSRMLEAERDKARNQIAAQVAHDIRSPLMSMHVSLSQIESAQAEPLAILKSAVARVEGIVQKLSAVSGKAQEELGTEAPRLTLMEPLIAGVFTEQRVRRPAHQKIHLSGLGSMPQIWTVVQVSEMQSALSNLINNAFEAGATEVGLKLTSEDRSWRLEISDNGAGIPADKLEKIFERGASFGKQAGTGLGLYQAKAAVEWSGGTLQVESAAGRGATFTLQVPKERAPAWLATEVHVDLDQPVYFVDDDRNVLGTWRAKAEALGLRQAVFLHSIYELEKRVPLTAWPEDAILVIDHNLGEDKKGLDVLNQIAIAGRGFLCTSDFDEKSIQDQIRKLNGCLVPKLWISQFEIKIRGS